MDISEQIELAASNLADSNDEDLSSTFRENLRFLVETSLEIGQDLREVDLSQAVQTSASNLAECADEELARNYRSNLKYLVDLVRTLNEKFSVSTGATQTDFVEPAEELLTTNQAAAVLDVSRATIMKKIESSELDYVMVGTHHRVPASSILAYKKRRLVSRERVAGIPYNTAGEAEKTNYEPTVRFGNDGVML